jgi:membrane-bound serine protease (ClpP class)
MQVSRTGFWRWPSVVAAGLIGAGTLAFLGGRWATAAESAPPATGIKTVSDVKARVISLAGAVADDFDTYVADAAAATPAGAPLFVDLDLHGGDPAAAAKIFRRLAARRASGPVVIYVTEASGPGVLLLAAADRVYARANAALGPGISAAAPESSANPLPLPVDEIEKLSAPAPYRFDLVRAFFEANYSFAVGDTLIKKPGAPLSLTGTEAARTVGRPPQVLLVEAVAPTLDQALRAYFGGSSFQTLAWSRTGFVEQVPPPMQATVAPAVGASAVPAAIGDKPAATPKPVEAAAPTPVVNTATVGKAQASVYVVPIQGEIGSPQLYILRRALKLAIENHVDTVVLDMDTLGGDLETTLGMMEALAKFDGRTITYVNDKAMSAGSYIAVVTNKIYLAPTGTIGAAAVVGGSGEDISSTMKQKIDSFMRGRVSALAGPGRYRKDVQRAMMDSAFEFKIGDKVIKPPGELLTLDAKAACEMYGEPPEPLLASGQAKNVDALLTQLFGANGYVVRDFHLSWSEALAKWLNMISPILIGAGVLLLFIEFKTPGFGIFGIGGIALLLLVFASHYIAGLAGYEPVILFVVGLILIALELFLFTGSLACGAVGLLCFFGSFVWAMTDVWPTTDYGLTPGSLTQPLFNLVLGLMLAGGGAALVLHFLPKSWFYGRLINEDSVPPTSYTAGSGGATATGAAAVPEPGAQGVAMTDLRPLGEIEIAGGRFQARATLGQIERGATVVVVSRKDFSLAVKKAE